jgi:SAM-dependent methyltransferase
LTDCREKFYANYHVTNQIGSSPRKEHYELNARQYKERWQHWLSADKSSACLDLACGSGEFLYHLHSLGYENIYGVDLNEVEIEHARQMGVPNLKCGNVFDYLQQYEAQFDLIAAFNLFEHLTKVEILELLELTYRALKPGGRLIVVTPTGLSPFAGATRFRDFSHGTSFTPSSWRQIFAPDVFSSEIFEEYGPIPYSMKGRIRIALWQVIRPGIMAYSYIEVGSPRDSSRVYTADLKVILTKVHF